MTDEDDARGDAAPESEGAISPEDAFAALADETRIDIVRALAGAEDDQVGFNQLRKRVGAKDSSGFNYHLRKLVGRFVRKGEDGYELTTAGVRVYGAMLSGSYTDSVDLDPIELAHPEDSCPYCDGTLVATYEDEKMSVACRACDRVLARSGMPPAAVEGRPPATVPAAYGAYLRAMIDRTKAGFCAWCSGRMVGRLELGHDDELPVDAETPVIVYECQRCLDELHATPGPLLLSHPAVVSFFYERGLDVSDVPPWRLHTIGPDATSVVAEDPLRVTVDVEYEDDVLTVTLDEAAKVVDTALSSESA